MTVKSPLTYIAPPLSPAAWFSNEESLTVKLDSAYIALPLTFASLYLNATLSIVVAPLAYIAAPFSARFLVELVEPNLESETVNVSNAYIAPPSLPAVLLLTLVKPLIVAADFVYIAPPSPLVALLLLRAPRVIVKVELA